MSLQRNRMLLVLPESVEYRPTERYGEQLD